jgi:hypothetical protein
LIAGFSGNPDVLDTSGNTALHLAAYMGRTECCFSLLREKADISAQNSRGQTAKEIVLQRIDELSEWEDKAKYQPLARMFTALEDRKNSLTTKFVEACIGTAKSDVQSLDLSQVVQRAPSRTLTQH